MAGDCHCLAPMCTYRTIHLDTGAEQSHQRQRGTSPPARVLAPGITESIPITRLCPRTLPPWHRVHLGPKPLLLWHQPWPRESCVPRLWWSSTSVPGHRPGKAQGCHPQKQKPGSETTAAWLTSPQRCPPSHFSQPRLPFSRRLLLLETMEQSQPKMNQLNPYWNISSRLEAGHGFSMLPSPWGGIDHERPHLLRVSSLGDRVSCLGKCCVRLVIV